MVDSNVIILWIIILAFLFSIPNVTKGRISKKRNSAKQNKTIIALLKKRI